MSPRARTRFAPSPTGDLHVGGAYVALASWVLARRAAGAFVVRVEDLDSLRVVPGSEARILEDLAWLGLDADEGPGASGSFCGSYGPYAQSARASRYDAALATLARKGDTYPCDCSRAEIARAASAPHAGEEVVYPGTCRESDPSRAMKRPPAVRLRVPRAADGTCIVAFVDLAAGAIRQDVAHDVGDFVLRRGDGIFAYQLAVLVDDVEMAISEVVRGDDLLPSTPRQILLAELLGHAPPHYLHLPMVVGEDGARLAKRTAGASVRSLRAGGVTSEEIVGAAAHALGFTDSPSPKTPRAVAAEARGREVAWPRAPFAIPASWAAAARLSGS